MPPESLRCKECQTTYPLDARYVCERCFGPLEVAYAGRTGSDTDPEALKRRIQAGPHSLWRYGDFLPVQSAPKDVLQAGWTPLLRADRLAAELGLGEVWIKNDAANPTHSFKDRVVSIALARARELGFETIACASTGNLANAVAAHAAAAGLESYVFIPSNLEEQKVLATGVYGTNVVAVRGNYDDVNRLCTELSGEHEWAFVNINMRPYYAEGSKTLAFETAEQLGFELPDRVVAPIASGSLFTKIARGFTGVARRGPARRQAADLQRRPGRGLLAGRQRVGPRAATSASRSSPTRSPSRWRSATRPTAPTRWSWRAPAAAGSIRSPTTRSARGSGCWPGRPGSSPRPPGASRPRCWPSSRSAATSTPPNGSSSTSPARG